MSTPPPSHLRVVIVEDSPIVREVLVDICQEDASIEIAAPWHLPDGHARGSASLRVADQVEPRSGGEHRAGAAETCEKAAAID